MKTVNDLAIRNNLGAILDDLEEFQEPILIARGTSIRAALITPEDFKTRFLDRQADEEQDRVVKMIRSLRGKPANGLSSVNVLRMLRGYPD